MEFRIIELPPFTAESSGVDPNFDFSEKGVLGKFDAYFSAIKPVARDCFMPRDFLFYDPENKGLVWWWVWEDYMQDGGYEKVQFDGGYYLCYHYRDQDEVAGAELHQAAMQFIQDSQLLELDERPNHYTMGHIITPKEISDQLGYAIMETFVPIKLKEK